MAVITTRIAFLRILPPSKLGYGRSKNGRELQFGSRGKPTNKVIGQKNQGEGIQALRGFYSRIDALCASYSKFK